jgi:nicotinate-nucleotide adenylyltransferase
MLELAIAGKPHFAISRIDLDRPGPCYTVDTIRLLRRELGPEPRLFFVEGADSLSDLLSWFQPQRLIELCEFAVVHRPGADVDLARLAKHLPGLADRVHWVQMPRLEISSSDIRARVRAGDPISYLLPAAVEDYIFERGLYQSQPAKVASE